MTLFVGTIIFIFGAVMGSFFSVIIYRVHNKKKGILFSRSVCPSCKKKLKWRHLVPIFSWVFLKGKCAYCGEKISSHYLLLELFSGLTFLGSFLAWNFVEGTPSIHDPSVLLYSMDWVTFEIFLFYLVELSFLIIIFFYDLFYKEIPDRISLPAIAIAIAGGSVIGTVEPKSMFIGGLTLFGFFAIQFFLSGGKWIGGGDLRLGALMGLLLGWEKGIVALLITYLIGGVVSLVLLIQQKVSKKTQIPFGPFLVIGTLVALFLGDIIIEWYLQNILI